MLKAEPTRTEQPGRKQEWNWNGERREWVRERESMCVCVWVCVWETESSDQPASSSTRVGGEEWGRHSSTVEVIYSNCWFHSEWNANNESIQSAFIPREPRPIARMQHSKHEAVACNTAITNGCDNTLRMARLMLMVNKMQSLQGRVAWGDGVISPQTALQLNWFEDASIVEWE